MRIKPQEQPSGGFFIRASESDPERGPFTFDSLSDLAQFGHIGADTLVRSSEAGEYSRLGDNSDLLAALFPEKKQFQFTSYQGKDPDAERPPLSVEEMFRCRGADSGPPVLPAERLPAQKDDAPEKSHPPHDSPALHVQNEPLEEFEDKPEELLDVGALLRQSAELARRRREEVEAETPDEPPERDREKQLRIFLLVTRWAIALALIGYGLSIWISTLSRPPSLVTVIEFFMGLVLIGMGVLCICFELTTLAQMPLDWALDICLGGREASVLPPPDYGPAREMAAAGDTRHALAAYRKLVGEYPKELGAYLEAMRLARQAGDAKSITAFHALALKNLTCDQDRNLFLAAESRMFAPKPDVFSEEDRESDSG